MRTGKDMCPRYSLAHCKWLINTSYMNEWLYLNGVTEEGPGKGTSLWEEEVFEKKSKRVCSGLLAQDWSSGTGIKG